MNVFDGELYPREIRQQDRQLGLGHHGKWWWLLIKYFQDSTDKNLTRLKFVWYPIQCSLLVHIWKTSILCPRTIQPHICTSMYPPVILGLTMDFQGAKSGWVTNLQCLTLEMPKNNWPSGGDVNNVLKRWQNERFNLLNVRKVSLLVNILAALPTSWTTQSVFPLITGVWPHWS